MATIPWPHTSEAPWNTLITGRTTWPGVATVKVKRGQKIDKKTAKGQNGAKLTFNGREAAAVEIEVFIYQEEDLDAFMACIASIEPDIGKKDPAPVDIPHPACAARNVKSIAIESMEGPNWDRIGKLSIKIHAVEFVQVPTSNATKTPDSSDPSDGDPTAGDPAFDNPTGAKPGPAGSFLAVPPNDTNP